MRWFWVDRFTEFVSGSHACGIKNVALDQEVLDEYCGVYPYFPPTLMIEGLAQLGGILIAEHFDWDKRIVLAKVGTASFQRPALPGDQLNYRVQLDGTQDFGASVTGSVTCGGEPLGEIDLMFAFLEEGRFAEGSLFDTGDLAIMLRIMNLFAVGVDAQGNPLKIPEKI